MTPVTSLPALLATEPSTREPRPAREAPAFAAELHTRADTASLVPAQRTPLSGSQAAEALEEAWRSVVGEAPDRSTVAVLAAHWAHETGRGQSMLNFNFGGIKGTGPSGLGAAYRTREGWGATEVRTTDTFRAYRTATEGATDYVGLLARRYPDAVEAARSGDPSGFVRALRERGYFTGNPEHYERNVSALSRQALVAGFDAMGTAEAGSEQIDLSRSLPFRGASAVPFDPAAMVPGRMTVDPIAFYDEITRATLRIAGEAGDDARSRDS